MFLSVIMILLYLRKRGYLPTLSMQNLDFALYIIFFDVIVVVLVMLLQDVVKC